jgi:alkylation response protein AidB-like acyl-CoA dehydrogenase
MRNRSAQSGSGGDPGLALTEPEVSDPSGMTTVALKKTHRINGTKCFISNAGIAHYIILFCKTDPSLGTKGISAILVETGTPGYTVSRQMEILAIDVVNELQFKDCLVPRKNLQEEASRPRPFAVPAPRGVPEALTGPAYAKNGSSSANPSPSTRRFR